MMDFVDHSWGMMMNSEQQCDSLVVCLSWIPNAVRDVKWSAIDEVIQSASGMDNNSVIFIDLPMAFDTKYTKYGISQGQLVIDLQPDFQKVGHSIWDFDPLALDSLQWIIETKAHKQNICVIKSSARRSVDAGCLPYLPSNVRELRLEGMTVKGLVLPMDYHIFPHVIGKYEEKFHCLEKLTLSGCIFEESDLSSFRKRMDKLKIEIE